MGPSLLRYRGFLINGFHFAVIALSLCIAFWIRFEFSLSVVSSPTLILGLVFMLPIKMAVFALGKLHKGWWRYAGLSDLLRLVLVNATASTVSAASISLSLGPEFPRSVYVIDFLL